MKKIIFCIIICTFYLPLHASIGYKNFSIGMSRINAEKIIKKEFLESDYAIDYNAVAGKANNIIEINNNSEGGKAICLYFNEKNILYMIIVFAGYMDELEYNGLIKNLIKKYKTPYNQIPNCTKPGYTLVGWLFQNRYSIICDIIDTDGTLNNTIMITYKDKKLEDQYQLYLYKFNEY